MTNRTENYVKSRQTILRKALSKSEMRNYNYLLVHLQNTHLPIFFLISDEILSIVCFSTISIVIVVKILQIFMNFSSIKFLLYYVLKYLYSRYCRQARNKESLQSHTTRNHLKWFSRSSLWPPLFTLPKWYKCTIEKRRKVYLHRM